MDDDVDDKFRPVSEVAAEWFVRIKDGDLTVAERREYLAWLKTSPVHIAEMLKVSRTFARLRDALKDEKADTLTAERRDLSNIIDFATRGIVPAAPAPHVGARRLRFAAAFTGLALASLLAVMVKSAVFDRTIETQAGEWRNVSLADGSMVRLGPWTKVKVEFGDKQRFVHLQSGEGYFEVAKDSKRPFIVTTDLVDVRAVGTAFGVARRESEVTVAVREGTVALTPNNRATVNAGGDSPRPAVEAASHESVPVSAGQKASVSTQSWPAGAERANLDRELAWIQKRLLFDAAVDTVGDAVREFNRRNSKQIVLSDATLAAKHFSGVFDADDPEAFMQFLERHERMRVVVLRDRPGVLRVEPRRQ